MDPEISEYMDKEVVIDTQTPYIYIGTLEAETENFVTLKDVDVHDHNESTKTKELYILEALKYGVKVNRHRVKVLKSVIVSISLLSEIKEY